MKFKEEVIIEFNSKPRNRKNIPLCFSCGVECILIEKHDAYVCLPCDLWRENSCLATDCIYCVRPDRPSDLGSV